MKLRNNKADFGFTLIEIIITLVVVAIVGAMMAAYFGSSITQSSLPIFRLTVAGKLNDIMEKITAEYDRIPRWQLNTSYALNAVVIPTPSSRNGYQYICTIAGTSDPSVEPVWPTVPGNTVTETTGVQWRNNGTAPILQDLQTKIAGGTADTGGEGSVGEGNDYMNQNFGTPTNPILISYRLIQNRFIKFTGSEPSYTEDPTPVRSIDTTNYGKYLKVTIALHPTVPNRTDETQTTLFVLR